MPEFEDKKSNASQCDNMTNIIATNSVWEHLKNQISNQHILQTQMWNNREIFAVICGPIRNKYLLNSLKITRRPVNVRTHIMFRPRSSTLLTTKLQLIGYQMLKRQKNFKTIHSSMNNSWNTKTPRYRADKLVVNRITKKDNNKNRIANVNYDKKLMSTIKKTQNKLTPPSDKT